MKTRYFSVKIDGNKIYVEREPGSRKKEGEMKTINEIGVQRSMILKRGLYYQWLIIDVTDRHYTDGKTYQTYEDALYAIYSVASGDTMIDEKNYRTYEEALQELTAALDSKIKTINGVEVQSSMICRVRDFYQWRITDISNREFFSECSYQTYEEAAQGVAAALDPDGQ